MVAQQLSFTQREAINQGREEGGKRRVEERALEGELLAKGTVVEELAVPVSRAPRSKVSPVVATRSSTRGAGSSAVLILEKAIQRAKEKTPGTSKSIDSFAIQQDIPDSSLLSVPRDSCIVFPSAAGNPAPLLSMLRARDLAQAALALARDKAAEELRREKELAQQEEGEEAAP
jgi:hypothetical protein